MNCLLSQRHIRYAADDVKLISVSTISSQRRFLDAGSPNILPRQSEHYVTLYKVVQPTEYKRHLLPLEILEVTRSLAMCERSLDVVREH